MRAGEIELPFPPASLSPNVRLHWSTARREELKRLHGTMSIADLAIYFDTTKGAIRGQVTRLGIAKKNDEWTPDDIEALRTAYAGIVASEDIHLEEVARSMGRLKSNVCRKARSLGLTDNRRKQKRKRKDGRKYGDLAAFRAELPRIARERIEKNGHPRGMLGKRHSQEVKARIGKASAERWHSMSKSEQEAYTTRAMKAAIAKNGKVGTLSGRVNATWKAGWREIGGKRHYFRSRWEANYARYLEWLKFRGDILDWQYEPETFWFEGIKRGVRSYLPDFRVHELNGDKPLHEVKGWMDARSKTTLKRMAKYHPQERIVLIREKEYRAISRLAALIGEWE